MNHRYDFIFLFDAANANPNGDPDAGNLPRVDPETNLGLVTDVCIKRKVRNYIGTTLSDQPPYEIYFKDGAVLNQIHERAYKHIGQKHEKKKLPKDRSKAREVTAFMCQNFWDIRTFGAVMSTEVNCGQVRGPAQIAFSRSVDPILTSEFAITRSSVTNEDDIAKERTIGRKFAIPYGLYRTHGTINPFLADNVNKDGLQLGTGFSEGKGKGTAIDGDDSDLELLFQSLEHAFDFDASAARPAGSMASQGLLVFRHDKKLGNAPAHKLFDRLRIESFEDRSAADGKPPRHFSDYAPRIEFDKTGKGDFVSLDDFIQPGSEKDLGNGVTLIRRI